MNPEEYRTLINRIVENRENQALVTELATQAADVYSERHTAFNTLNEQHTAASNQIKELQRTNMNLFLKVGNPVAPEKINEPEPLQYDDLLKNF